MPARGVSAAGSRVSRCGVSRTEGAKPVIVLGVILILVGYLLPVPGIIATIGWILLVIGLVLLVLGRMGRPVGGRRYWY
jgi:membrane-bound ClpP family serine protease